MRTDRNFSRDVLRELASGPLTVDDLAARTGYQPSFIAKRMRAWAEDGRVVGRLLGVGADGRPVIAYRLAEAAHAL